MAAWVRARRGMNVATVRRASAGLARHLLDAVEGARDAGVVVGHDARHGSERFAAEAAAVFSGAGLRTYRLPPLAPTPLLAFAVRHLGCAAGVMVTASHNPPQDNGYKVYLGDGAQIAPPADEQIAAAIERVGSPATLPLGDGGEPVDVAEDYLAAILAALPAAPRARRPDRLHAAARRRRPPVPGGARARRLRGAARRRSSRRSPIPTSRPSRGPTPRRRARSTLRWPAAAAHDADVMLANDPDADRLAVAVPGPGGWRRLHGDEIGALLADFRLEHCEDPRRALLVTTVASSTLLGRMAEAAGAALRRDAHRLQVDDARCRRGARSSGCCSPTRRRSATRFPTSCATRTASPRRS